METALSTSMAMPPADLIKTIAELPPRDVAVCGKNTLEIATSSYDMAVSCLYCVPVGKEKGTTRQKFKLGESVRLAEITQSQFGRIWCDENIIERDTAGDRVTAKAVVFDLTTMSIQTGLASVNVWGGRWEVAEKAACSIARRDAVLKHFRPYTQLMLPDIKKRIVQDLATDSEGVVKVKTAWTALCKWFGEKHDVQEGELRDIVSGADGATNKVVLLIGIRNSMEEGTVSFENVFGRDKKKAPARTGGKAKTEPKPAPVNKTPAPSDELPPIDEGQDPLAEPDPIVTQTAKQEYATLQVQLVQAIGGDKAGVILSDLQEGFGEATSEWNEAMFAKAVKSLKKEISSAVE